MAGTRPRKPLAGKSRKPVRKNPANPNFSVGKLFSPKVPGKFYVLGQTITKVEEVYSEPQGPFGSIRLTQHYLFGDEEIIATFDIQNGKWLLDSRAAGYLELTIYNGGEEVPQ